MFSVCKTQNHVFHEVFPSEFTHNLWNTCLIVVIPILTYLSRRSNSVFLFCFVFPYPSSSLAFRHFFFFFVFLIFRYFGSWISEFGHQNPSSGRKFNAESDFRVKTKRLWRPGAKKEEKPKLKKKDFFSAAERLA